MMIVSAKRQVDTTEDAGWRSPRTRAVRRQGKATGAVDHGAVNRDARPSADRSEQCLVDRTGVGELTAAVGGIAEWQERQVAFVSNVAATIGNRLGATVATRETMGNPRWVSMRNSPGDCMRG
jgi:hypothetical protein